ncbi:hypothetical protein [Microvirga zambiensis]|uniref:hypothetical protein n=1 Tax=Microvirga zambiensis TaxID=1402137 RepID=UPI00191DE532|nr:hypothetical protein [Microvirga zambiensis]
MGNAGYGNHTDDAAKKADAKQPQQGSSRKPASDKMPAAGPHDKPHLTNPDATPGTGSLPEPGEHDTTNSTSS